VSTSAPLAANQQAAAQTHDSRKPDQRQYPVVSQGIRLSNADEGANLGGFEIIDCGFCSQDTPCVCADAAAALATAGSRINKQGVDKTSQRGPSLVRGASELQILGNSSPGSILDHLPPYAPPVPLRRLSKAYTTSATERWIINPNPTHSVNSTLDGVRGNPERNDDSGDACTGDPVNCPACADDPANQAFCAALGDAYSGGEEELTSSATATPPPLSSFANSGHHNGVRSVNFLDQQDDAADPIMSRAVELSLRRLSVPALCCGDPKLCGGGCDANPNAEDRTPLLPLPSCSSIDADINSISISISREVANVDAADSSDAEKKRSEGGKRKDMIPCNAAWAQLSSHPNIAFADLSLLAEVVARRDHIHIASSPSSSTTAYSWSGAPLEAPSDHSSPPQWPTSASRSDQRQDGARTLVRQDHHILNGLGHRRRVHQVPNDGVQDALALLNGVRTST
jgi:AP-1-like factor